MIIVQPVGSCGEALQIEVTPQLSTVADLKAVISSQTGATISSQRLVALGRVLRDAELLESLIAHAPTGVSLKIFLAVRSIRIACGQEQERGPEGQTDNFVSGGSSSSKSSSLVQAENIQLLVRMVDWQGGETVQMSFSPSMEAAFFMHEVLRELQNQELVLAGEPCRYRFVSTGKILRPEGTISDAGLKSGDVVVVVPPKASLALRIWRKLMTFIRCAVSSCILLLSLLLRFPTLVFEYLCNAWQDPWSLVRPARSAEVINGPRIRTLGWTPAMFRYAPGQNPNGEDLTCLFSQGLLGGG